MEYTYVYVYIFIIIIIVYCLNISTELGKHRDKFNLARQKMCRMKGFGATPSHGGLQPGLFVETFLPQKCRTDG